MLRVKRSRLGAGLLSLLLISCGESSISSRGGDGPAMPSIPYAYTDVGLVKNEPGAGERYVAMGDSAAAGPLILMQRNDPLDCFRSDANYPSILAALAGVARFQDMSCSSALTDHLFSAQNDNPPQLDALRPDTTLVTIGPMGANDIGTLDAFVQCAVTGAGGLGPECAGNYPVTDGRDQFSPLLEKVADNIGKALDEAHRRSPKARIYVVGYGLYFPEDGCFPIQPYSAEASNYIQGLHNRVNEVLRQQAELHGARYVSTQEGEAAQHTSCALPLDRWLVGVAPDSPAFPFHPSALGMQNYGAMAKAFIDAHP